MNRKRALDRWLSLRKRRALACILVFATVYALILPAVTAERPDLSGPGEPSYAEERLTEASRAESQEDSETPKAGDIVEIRDIPSGEETNEKPVNQDPPVAEPVKETPEEVEAVETAFSEDEKDAQAAEDAEKPSDSPEMRPTEEEALFPLTEVASEDLQTAEAEETAHLAVVVEPEEDRQDDAVVLVAEQTEDGVQVHPVSLEEGGVDLMDAETAEDYPNLEEEVRELLDAIREEAVLEPEQMETLEEQVEQTLDDLAYELGGSCQAEADGILVLAQFGPDVFPEGVEMKAETVEPEDYAEAVANLTGKTGTQLRTLDISFWCEGQEVEPQGEVKITFQADFINEREEPAVVHFAEDGKATVMDAAVQGDEIVLKTDSFSVYAISYTVDFHWYVEGETFDVSIPGGDVVSFRFLIQKLHLLETEEASPSVDAETFLANIREIRFSDESLVRVEKITEDTTVGDLKESLGLQPDYSAELTRAQIAMQNARTLTAPDWALISLRPFDTEETLTVTMTDGTVFTIVVTDAKPAQVTGLDTDGLDGIFTVNMFNYGPSSSLDKEGNHVKNASSSGSEVQSGINGLGSLDFMSYGTQGTGINHFTGDSTIRQGIVKNLLNEDRFPVLTDGEDLNYLFNTTSYENGVKDVYENVQGLFYKSNRDGSASSSGSYYSYDSDRYYAYLNQASNKIEFYQTYKMDGGDQSVIRDGMQNNTIGFFPFTVPDNSKKCPHPDDIGWGGGHPGGKSNGQYGSGYYDHQFGLSLSGTFQMPEGGKVNDEDMIFSFSGDDDMWVFIDNVLVLDIGGIHHPSSGTINFSANSGDGLVHVDNAVASAPGTTGINAGGDVTIRSLVEAAGGTWDSSDYSAHTIQVFYLERGGIYSNCKITFNIPLVPVGDITFNKSGQNASGDVGRILEHIPGAEFQLFLDAACTEPFTRSGNAVTAVSDENGTVTFTNIPTIPKQGYYYMKEIKAPEGYEVSKNVYLIKYISDDNGKFTVFTSPIDETTGKPSEDESEWANTADIPNEWAFPIDLSLTKKWGNGSDNAVPAGASATFSLMRKSTREGQEEETVRLAYHGDSQTYQEDRAGSETFTLNDQSGWTVHFKELAKVDDHGFPYEYYFVETAHTPADYSMTIFAGDYGNGDHPVDADDPKNVTVLNTKDGELPPAEPEIRKYVEKRTDNDDYDLTLTAKATSAGSENEWNVASPVKNVTITDTLSQYARPVENAKLVIMVLDENGDAVGTAVGTIGEPVTLTLPATSRNEEAVLTACYQEVSGDRQILLNFPSDYELEEEWDYRVTMTVEPTLLAYEEYRETGYPTGVTGDPDTDVVPGTSVTSSGKPGFPSNSEAHITYDGGEKEYPDPVIQTLTTQVQIKKTNMDKTEGLQGAVFTLYRKAQEGDPTDRQIKVEGIDEPVVVAADSLTSGSDGFVRAEKLIPGDYYLAETRAPEGYVAYSGFLTFSVVVEDYGSMDTWNLSVLSRTGEMGSDLSGPDGDGTYTLLIPNNLGVMLPSTGGAGNGWCYLLGVACIVLAGSLLVVRQRKTAE